MSASHAVVLVGYASILLELTWLAVPSAVSTLRLVQARTAWRTRLLHTVSVLVAVAGFLLPGLLCAVASWRATLVWPSLVSALGSALGCALVVTGRALTLWAVAVLRGRSPPGALVRHGPYAYTRNPALIGLETFLCGAVLVVPGPATAAGALAYVVHMHRRLRLEEEFLLAHAGTAYAAYHRCVPRYVPTRRRRVPR